MELLIVIGIIATLMSIILPAVSSARDQAKRITCRANLRSQTQAMFLYAGANNDRLPNGNPPLMFVDYDGANRIMVDFNMMYVKEPRVFWCPADRDDAPTAIVTADPLKPNSARISYEFYCLFWPPELGPVLTRLKGRAPLVWDVDGAESPAVSTIQNHGHKGGNVAYADGHVDWQHAIDWDGPSWPAPAKEFYPN